MSENHVLLSGFKIKQSEKAILLGRRTGEVWLPKSQIVFLKDGPINSKVQIKIPRWLAEKNNLLPKDGDPPATQKPEMFTPKAGDDDGVPF